MLETRVGDVFIYLYIYVHVVIAAEACLLNISVCLSMMDESLIFLIPVPQNTKSNVLGSEITNRAAQRSPNQAKCFFLTYKTPCYKIH